MNNSVNSSACLIPLIFITRILDNKPLRASLKLIREENGLIVLNNFPTSLSDFVFFFGQVPIRLGLIYNELFLYLPRRLTYSASIIRSFVHSFINELRSLECC